MAGNERLDVVDQSIAGSVDPQRRRLRAPQFGCTEQIMRLRRERAVERKDIRSLQNFLKRREFDLRHFRRWMIREEAAPCVDGYSLQM